MSRFQELLGRGRALTAVERIEQLRALTLHPSFAALLAEIQSDWEAYGSAIARQDLAAHRGCLEHCAGSMHALEMFVEKLRGLSESPLPTARKTAK